MQGGKKKPMNLTTVVFMTVIAIWAVAFVWYTFFGEQPGYKETTKLWEKLDDHEKALGE